MISKMEIQPNPCYIPQLGSFCLIYTEDHYVGDCFQKREVSKFSSLCPRSCQSGCPCDTAPGEPTTVLAAGRNCSEGGHRWNSTASSWLKHRGAGS